MNPFSIQSRLTLKDYRKIYFTLLYKKVWIISITAFSVFLFILTPILWSAKRYDILSTDYYQYSMIIFFMSIWIPLGALYTIWRNFKSTYILGEPTTYEFFNEGFTATGESFNSKSDWNKMYRVRIIKGWLIIYHSRMTANMIMTSAADAENIEALKHFLKTGNFKAKLKW